jgi:hypothetical protein
MAVSEWNLASKKQHLRGTHTYPNPANRFHAAVESDRELEQIRTPQFVEHTGCRSQEANQSTRRTNTDHPSVVKRYQS